MSAQPKALRLARALIERHGVESFQGDAAAELHRLYPHELANEMWQVKTQWVQDTAKPEELGMHRADVMRQRLVRAEAQRDALLEALKLAADFLEHSTEFRIGHPGFEGAQAKARAAIAKAEEA